MHPITTAQRSRIVAYATAQIGQPYLYGGKGRPFDCSELTMKALARGDVRVDHNSSAQVRQLYSVPNYKTTRALLLPGDVMFWYGSIKHPDSVTHCGIYVGKSLGRYMVVAAVDEAHGVMKHSSSWALKPCGFGLLGR